MDAGLTFTVTSISKSRRSSGENIFTGMRDSTSVYVVRTTSNRFRERHLDLYFSTEFDAQKFSEGQTYTAEELMSLFES